MDGKNHHILFYWCQRSHIRLSLRTIVMFCVLKIELYICIPMIQARTLPLLNETPVERVIMTKCCHMNAVDSCGWRWIGIHHNDNRWSFEWILCQKSIPVHKSHSSFNKTNRMTFVDHIFMKRIWIGCVWYEHHNQLSFLTLFTRFLQPMSQLTIRWIDKCSRCPFYLQSIGITWFPINGTWIKLIKLEFFVQWIINTRRRTPFIGAHLMSYVIQ